MKNYFFAWSKLGAFGVILTMQLEPPKYYYPFLVEFYFHIEKLTRREGIAIFAGPCKEGKILRRRATLGDIVQITEIAAISRTAACC